MNSTLGTLARTLWVIEMKRKRTISRLNGSQSPLFKKVKCLFKKVISSNSQELNLNQGMVEIKI